MKSGYRLTRIKYRSSTIRSTLFVLEQVAKFPFDLFQEYHGPFWQIVVLSLETSVVMGLWRLLFDQDGDSLTLRQLKNQVMAKAQDDSVRRQFTEQLSLQNIKKRIKLIEDRVICLRNKHFAHTDKDTAMGKAALSQVTLEELRALATAAHDLINAIGVDTDYVTIHPEYEEAFAGLDGSSSRKLDVEALLDDMVARCEDFRMPETKPYDFQFYWKSLTPIQRDAFNDYRRKFGLPEISSDG